MWARWWTLALHAEGSEAVGRSVFLCLDEHVASDENRLFQINKESQAGLDWVVLRRKIGAIERIAHLQPKRVARAQAAGPDAKLFARLQHRVPDLRRIFRGKKHLDSVFAGVAGPGNREVHSVQLELYNVVARRELDLAAEQRVKKIDHARPLNRDPAKAVTAIRQLTGSRQMLLQPCEIFIHARRIHHQ